MRNGEYEHHYLFVTADQVSSLHRLAEAANFLFRRAQAISVLDLLYAALWRQISATASIAATMTLTVLEKPRRPDVSPDRGLSVLHHTFRSAGDALVLQPLVGTAQMIRRCLTDIADSSDYEGWLIDSHKGGGSQPVDGSEFEGLVGSSLSPPFLRQYLAGFYKMVNPSQADSSSPGVGQPSLRLFCINGVLREGLNWSEGVATWSDLKFDNAGEFVSVDLWLPQDELNCFKVLYGDSCFVDNTFFEN